MDILAGKQESNLSTQVIPTSLHLSHSPSLTSKSQDIDSGFDTDSHMTYLSSVDGTEADCSSYKGKSWNATPTTETFPTFSPPIAMDEPVSSSLSEGAGSSNSTFQTLNSPTLNIKASDILTHKTFHVPKTSNQVPTMKAVPIPSVPTSLPQPNQQDATETSSLEESARKAAKPKRPAPPPPQRSNSIGSGIPTATTTSTEASPDLPIRARKTSAPTPRPVAFKHRSNPAESPQTSKQALPAPTNPPAAKEIAGQHQQVSLEPVSSSLSEGAGSSNSTFQALNSPTLNIKASDILTHKTFHVPKTSNQVPTMKEVSIPSVPTSLPQPNQQDATETSSLEESARKAAKPKRSAPLPPQRSNSIGSGIPTTTTEASPGLPIRARMTSASSLGPIFSKPPSKPVQSPQTNQAQRMQSTSACLDDPNDDYDDDYDDILAVLGPKTQTPEVFNPPYPKREDTKSTPTTLLKQKELIQTGQLSQERSQSGFSIKELQKKLQESQFSLAKVVEGEISHPSNVPRAPRHNYGYPDEQEPAPPSRPFNHNELLESKLFQRSLSDSTASPLEVPPRKVSPPGGGVSSDRCNSLPKSFLSEEEEINAERRIDDRPPMPIPGQGQLNTSKSIPCPQGSPKPPQVQKSTTLPRSFRPLPNLPFAITSPEDIPPHFSKEYSKIGNILPEHFKKGYENRESQRNILKQPASLSHTSRHQLREGPIKQQSVDVTGKSAMQKMFDSPPERPPKKSTHKSPKVPPKPKPKSDSAKDPYDYVEDFVPWTVVPGPRRATAPPKAFLSPTGKQAMESLLHFRNQINKLSPPADLYDDLDYEPMASPQCSPGQQTYMAEQHIAYDLQSRRHTLPSDGGHVPEDETVMNKYSSSVEDFPQDYVQMTNQEVMEQMKQKGGRENNPYCNIIQAGTATESLELEDLYYNVRKTKDPLAHLNIDVAPPRPPKPRPQRVPHRRKTSQPLPPPIPPKNRDLVRTTSEFSQPMQVYKQSNRRTQQKTMTT